MKTRPNSHIRLLLRAAVATAATGLFVLSAAAVWLWLNLHRPVPIPPRGVVIDVPAGTDFLSVAHHLQRAGLVAHPRVLALWARWQGLDRGLRPGRHVVRRPTSPADLVHLLRQEPDERIRVTVPEGWTVKEIAAELERAGLGGADAFLCVARDASFLQSLALPGPGLEGFLFPDTYTFSPLDDPETILRAMVRRYREVAKSLVRDRVAAGLTELEMVTLASLIEKETSRPEERPLISGVFHNRLRRGMRLQCDPTVIYALGPRYRGRLLRADLRFPSPYNTYIHTGLPPGPIASPGRAALEAAVRPAKTDALYFVARPDGSHVFSRTLREHNRAVARQRRLRLRESSRRRQIGGPAPSPVAGGS